MVEPGAVLPSISMSRVFSKFAPVLSYCARGPGDTAPLRGTPTTLACGSPAGIVSLK